MADNFGRLTRFRFGIRVAVHRFPITGFTVLSMCTSSRYFPYWFQIDIDSLDFVFLNSRGTVLTLERMMRTVVGATHRAGRTFTIRGMAYAK